MYAVPGDKFQIWSTYTVPYPINCFLPWPRKHLNKTTEKGEKRRPMP